MNDEKGNSMKTENRKMHPGYANRRPLSVVSSVGDIIFRIKHAQQESPIAVFISDRISGGLIAVFGSTIRTRRVAVKQNQNFIGMFDKTCDLKSVKSILARAAIA